uniref:Reverse transcriptase Ty1/copia-type domain-containing protein n=1 Tax=Kwoniella pini CBS 10737 TaxID=1296096 RepID=A0A1B9I2P1_9TREE|nr:uncharacterized protein I206_04339 [Kwoniella pini CBS 10737]OCF49812.1 hypothetical protein I206_04339 [Kwoniella pini CBS 10737]
MKLLSRVDSQNRSNSPDPVEQIDTSHENVTDKQLDTSEESIDPLPITDDYAIAMAAMSTLFHQSYKEALSSGDQQQWNLAIKNESEKMSKYKVWEVVNRLIICIHFRERWVYFKKIDGENGQPSKYKARQVAKCVGVDY